MQDVGERIVGGYTFRLGPRKRPEYQWGSWLDGTAWRLRKGVHFHVQASSMRSAAHSQAKARGLLVRTQIEDDSTIVIQAVKP